jgi:hypothetical protein
LMDENHYLVDGLFYEAELQVVQPESIWFTHINKILHKKQIKGRQWVLVNWKGEKPLKTRWIPADKISKLWYESRRFFFSWKSSWDRVTATSHQHGWITCSRRHCSSGWVSVTFVLCEKNLHFINSCELSDLTTRTSVQQTSNQHPLSVNIFLSKNMEKMEVIVHSCDLVGKVSVNDNTPSSSMWKNDQVFYIQRTKAS